MGALQGWAMQVIFKIVISFFMRQLQRFKENLDWNQLEKDIDKKIADLLPGTWLDAEAIQLANNCLNAVRVGLGEQERIKNMIELLTENKWDEAFNLLKDYVIVYWNTTTVAEQKTKDMMFDGFC